jgi:hypothetical protein
MKRTIALIIFMSDILTSIAFAQDEGWRDEIRNQADSVVDGGTAVTDGETLQDEWANDTRRSAEEANGFQGDSQVVASESTGDDWTTNARRSAEEANNFQDDSQAVASESTRETPQIPQAQPKPKKKSALSFPYRRFVEFGVNGNVGLANNLVGLSDILKKNIELDMNKLSGKVKDDGWNIDVNVDSDVFFNFNVSPRWGFGFFASVSGALNATISKSFMTLIAEGNIKNPSQSGSISVSGGVFTDVGLDIHARFLKEDKLKISLIPAMFVPVVYIPQSGVNYQLNAEDNLSVRTWGSIDVYTPIFMESIVEDSSFGSDLLNVNKILGQKGFDFSLTAEYELFDWLNVGGGFTHIPFSPAVLGNHLSVSIPEDKEDIINMDDDAKGGLITGNIDDLTNFPNADDLKPVYDNKSYEIIRPMRFDVYADYKPFKRNLFIIRPNIGFTVFTPEEKARFNASVKVQLNTPVLLIHASTGYDELMWQHKLWLGLNLRILEVDVGLHLSSQDFEQSFDMSGAGVTVGVRFGF